MRRKTIFLLSAVALVLAVLMAPNAVEGTVLIQKDLRDLVVESSDIVLGRVVDINVTWNKEETRIYTNVVLVVEGGIKGDFKPNEKIRFQTIGGTVEDVTLKVPGSPKFAVDERVIVFFGGEPNINTPITGWEQGKFTVENDIILENGRYLNDFIGEIKALMTQTEK